MTDKRREEDVTYADFNVRKYTSSRGVSGGLVRRFMHRCADHVDALAPAGSSIADIGAGEGTMTDFLRSRLPDRRLVAVEYEAESSDMFHRAFPDLTFLRGSAYELPLATDSVEVATAFEVLEHLGDPQTAVREMARIARSYVVVTVPYEPYFRLGNMARGRYLSRLGNTPGHINHWRQATLRALLRTGLEQVTVRPLFPWLLGHGVPRSPQP